MTPLPPRTRSVLGVALTLVALHAALGARYGIFRDELYYLACGEHLAWGYVDHPPVIALVARVSRILFGHWLPGLRLAPTMCAAATAILAAEIARTLRGGAFAQLVAAIAVAIAPAYLVIDGFLSMNCFEPVVWSAGALLAVLAVCEQGPRAWYGFGVVCGLGLMTKHSTLFFGAALAAGLLATPHRRELTTRGPWIAIATAATLFAPNVLWEVAHGWPTVEFLHNARVEKMVRFGPLAFLREQVVSMHPVSALLWLAGLAWLLFAERARPWRFLGVAWVTLYVLFVATGAKPYYLAPFYPVLFAAGGVALESKIASPAARNAIAALLVAVGALIAPLGLPLLSPAGYVRWSSAMGLTASNGERSDTGVLPQWFADQFGWEPMVTKIAAAYSSLPPEEQRVAAIYGINYGEAGAVDWFGPALGLPHAVSGHNNYFLWGPPQEGRGAVLVALGNRPDLERLYTDVRKVDETDAPLAMPSEHHRAIYVCRGPRRPLGEVWTSLKVYL
jgi:4-amino-4-deoxy-L-arabinose transferase-like glycosyltransferase